MIKLFKNLKPFLFMVIGSVILMFVQSISTLLLPKFMADIVDNGIVKGNTNTIMIVGKYMVLVAAIGGFAAIGASYIAAKVAIGFGRDIREKVFAKAQYYSVEEFETIGTSSLITRTTNDIFQIQQILVMILRLIITAPLTAIGGIALAYSQDSKLTIVLAISLPILAIGIFTIGKMGIPLYKEVQKRLDKLNQIARENLTGVRVIRAFNKQDFERNRFTKANNNLLLVSRKVNRVFAGLAPFMLIVMNFSIIAVVWMGGIRINNNSLQVGELMSFISYITQIMFSFIMLSILFSMIPRASASATRINEVLDQQSKLSDKTNGIVPIEKGYVEFKNVSFKYPGEDTAAIKNVNFSAKPGEVTAIIGGTGSGKSTLINLIPRFYDVSEGQILVDGVDVKDLELRLLRSKIGYVPQKAVLFSGTIIENIRYGKENASDEDVKNAAEIAQATEFINNMKLGFESHIAQGGTNVSGGQKQRLSIARTLVRKPEIYIFDDSFSALDFKTDAKLREALKKETKESTVIIVAQRVSTVRDADRIIVLENGNVVGMGKHKELLKQCDVYKEIVSSQFSKEEIA